MQNQGKKPSRRCLICKYEFESEKLANEHMEFIHAEGTFPCEKCNKYTFSTRGALKFHQILPSECLVSYNCDSDSDGDNSYKEIKDMIEEDKKAFDDDEFYQELQHRAMNLDGKEVKIVLNQLCPLKIMSHLPFMCNYCSFDSPFIESLQSHYEEEHRDQELPFNSFEELMEAEFKDLIEGKKAEKPIVS